MLWAAYVGDCVKLLTPAASNTKTAKNASMGNYLSYILHLAPARMSGYNVCPMASRGCEAACLNTAGRGQFQSVQAGRLRKTKMFFEAREQFLQLLVADLQAVVRKAERESMQAVVRLNGTSDLNWLSIKTDNGQNVFERFPSIQFYDYTKIIVHLKRLKLSGLSNYHLTFSKSEDNNAAANEALKLGFNVAAVFAVKGAEDLPATYAGRPLIDGDSHDLRFLDLKPADGIGAVVGLKAKGRARKDASGFVINLSINTRTEKVG
jgi:hypothetical protein